MGPRVSASAVRRAQRLAARLPAKWDRRARGLGKLLLDYRGARADTRRSLLFRAMRRFSPLLAAPHGRAVMLVDATDEVIGRAVFIRGEYERLYMEAAVNFLRAAGPLKPLFVDVGANIGTSTLDALLEFGFDRAVCFEPDRRNFRILRANVVLNELEDRVTTHRLALSDADGEAVLLRSPANFGDSRLADGADPAQGEETVGIRRLDSLVAEGAVDPASIGMMWIDAQGHDPRVLEGARAAIGKGGFPVVAEYWPQGLEETGLDLMERLVGEMFSRVVDLRRLVEGGAQPLAASEIGVLRAGYRGGEFTDLLLLP